MVQRHVPRPVLDDEAANAVNLAQDHLFARYDWRQTLKALPPFYLIPNSQDHGAPFISMPNDFHGLRIVNLHNFNSRPPLTYPPLKIVKNLEITHVRSQPHSICFNPESDSFRVFPRVPEHMGCPYWFISGQYKKRPTKILPTTLNSTIPLDDEYLEIFREGILWAAMKLAKDPRAGEINYQGGFTQITGQMAAFYHTMDKFAAQESVEQGDQFISPSEALAPIYGYPSMGLFGPFGF